MKKVVYPAKLTRSGAAILLLVITFCLLFATSPAFAQTPQPPNPQPCKFPVQKTDKNAANYQEYDLTDNFIAAPDGDAPIKISLTFQGKDGEEFPAVPQTFPFEVNFSKLQAVFAPTTSNYLEGNFQDENHQQVSLTDMDSSQINNYYGANQKLIPKYLTDLQKVKYVDYVSTHPSLGESANKIADIDGNNPKTIYDLVTQFNSPKKDGADQDPATWGKYWPKIPTAYSEFYQGQIEFRYALGSEGYNAIIDGVQCAAPFYRHIKFVMPEYFRTAAISGQLNQVLVPFGAQADPNHTILGQKSTAANFIDTAVGFCKQLFKAPSFFQKKIGEIISISFNFVNPIKTVFAQSPNAKSPCIKPIKGMRTGSAPYCPLPLEEARNPDVSCSPGDVSCTFTITWPSISPYSGEPLNRSYTINALSPDCSQDKDEDGKPLETYTCIPILRIWPNFQIPWAARVWNNTTYGGTDKKTPGIFGIFTPSSVIGENVLPSLEEPAKSQESQPEKDIKIDNLGGVACNQYFSKDLALKPIALQQALGISQDCGQ